MRFFDLFLKFYEIEKLSGSGFFHSVKSASSYAFKTQKHHFSLVRDFKMTPAFYMMNRYYSKSHDAAYVGLQRRLFLEMKKKQTARSEINTKAVDVLISTSRFNDYSKAWIFKPYFGQMGKILKYTQKIIVRETEIKRPQSIKENMQEWLLYSVKLYHESLQNLIEGQREVLRDKKFVFEDNKSVDDKMQGFEEKNTKIQKEEKRNRDNSET